MQSSNAAVKSSPLRLPQAISESDTLKIVPFKGWRGCVGASPRIRSRSPAGRGSRCALGPRSGATGGSVCGGRVGVRGSMCGARRRRRGGGGRSVCGQRRTSPSAASATSACAEGPAARASASASASRAAANTAPGPANTALGPANTALGAGAASSSTTVAGSATAAMGSAGAAAG
eukprot:scaffold16299_cov63-Phaeocystis_antarctica.AAC.8